jgi:hypothetical protein
VKSLSQGWQFNVIASFQKGNPFTLYSNGNASEQNNFLDRPDAVGPIPRANPRNPNQTFTSGCTSGTATGSFWLDPTNIVCSPCPFSDPTCQKGEVGVPLFTFGNIARNAMRGPGINNWDMSIVKKTRIGEEAKSVEFRTEFFNAFNHTQFSNPDNKGFSGTFGQVTSTRVDARIIQFGLKFYF